MRISDWSSDVCSSDLDDDIIAQLTDYIRIPNKSPMFDPQWAEHGYMDAAVALMEKWARSKLPSLNGATLEVVRLPGRTPLIYIDVPAANGGSDDDCVLLYGHLDKQPEMNGRSEEHTSEIQSIMRISYAVFCLKTK